LFLISKEMLFKAVTEPNFLVKFLTLSNVLLKLNQQPFQFFEQK